MRSPLIGKTIKDVKKSNYGDKGKPIAEIEYCNIYFTDGSWCQIFISDGKVIIGYWDS